MIYTIDDFNRDVQILSNKIISRVKKENLDYKGIYAIPRGGITLGIALSYNLCIPIVDKVFEGVLVVDDIVDSGNTRETYSKYDFACLHVKKHSTKTPTYFVSSVEDWVYYWWEEGEHPIEESITRLLQAIGEDPTREGLKGTPRRYAKALEHLLSGYKRTIEPLVTTFNSETYSEMILLKDIETYSMCEHHLLPFFGKTHVAYIPDGKVIGVSKIARIIEVFARRLQIQERLTEQIADAINKTLTPKGVAVTIQASHFCMKMRGVEKQNSLMVTSALRGVFLENDSTRAEFYQLVREG